MHPRGWTEPSATIVHRALRALNVETTTLFWNVVPTHPSADQPLSNRTPTKAEIEAGVEWLNRLTALVEPLNIAAIGNSAASQLRGLRVVRHPANGGARLFADQLAAVVRGIG